MTNEWDAYGRRLPDEQFAVEVWYVDLRGLWLAVGILVKTLLMMVAREGVSLAGHITT